MKGIREAKAIFREFKPDAVLSMGAFPSIPASVAAWRSGIPLFLHDGNARIGKSNRVFSRIGLGLCLHLHLILCLFVVLCHIQCEGTTISQYRQRKQPIFYSKRRGLDFYFY